MKFLAASVMAVLGLAFLIGDNLAQEKPKFTIKEVMKKAHAGKDSLLSKVASGKASDDDKKELASLYKSLSENAPPKGDKEAWKKKTVELLETATKAVKGDGAAAAKLKDLANCKSCHSEYK